MYVILHGNNIFCGYSPTKYLVWEKFSFENNSIRPAVFFAEIEAVAEGNFIQREGRVAVLVVPIEEWIAENKK